VGRFIREQIGSSGGVTPGGAARALEMNLRAMRLKLRQEGSSFAGELDGARLELGLRWVTDSDRPLKEIGFSLGFSHVESFHRAFKRWTGRSPQEYRKLARLVGVHSAAPGHRQQDSNEKSSGARSRGATAKPSRRMTND
jgi:AraC-like DNA-binding protein